ncbi:hypothetical protein FRUB_00080 [Fimbriiglobus ruber]|uniref:Uncharacterized protein n=1 Tax=Fimbriiglobus ruber TaxID=1908690 RepID=A0A225DYE4_9BACT|nr:hypothetical protein FRUB_00080 [Fimbriiglobus ruber]
MPPAPDPVVPPPPVTGKVTVASLELVICVPFWFDSDFDSRQTFPKYQGIVAPPDLVITLSRLTC